MRLKGLASLISTLCLWQLGLLLSSSAFAATAELRWSEEGSDDFLAEIQALYKQGNPAEALTRHINNLLEFYAYGDERVIAGSRVGTPSRHRIHLSDRGEIITTSVQGGEPQQSRLRVFGVNPYVNYQCVESTASCWILHPVTSDPWLQFVANPDASRELTRSLTELIKLLQSR